MSLNFDSVWPRVKIPELALDPVIEASVSLSAEWCDKPEGWCEHKCVKDWHQEAQSVSPVPTLVLLLLLPAQFLTQC